MKGKELSPNSKNYNCIHKQLLCLERWLGTKGKLLLLQRTKVCFLALISSYLQTLWLWFRGLSELPSHS